MAGGCLQKENLTATSGCLNVALRRLIGRIGRIDKEGYATGCRHDLAQQLHALGHQFVGKEVDAGGIAARAVETCYQAELDRVTSYAEHDRDRRGRGLSRESSSRGAWRGNHTHLPTNEISHQLWQTIILTVGPAKFGDHVPALHKTAISKPLPERCNHLRAFAGGCHVEKSYHRHRWLLRARRQRPRCHAAEQRNEIAAGAHSITSSASARSLSGISSPSAFAVPRLITNSNLVGCMTGRLAGFSPLRTRPAYTPTDDTRLK